jgi:hypothetical protein
MGLGWDEARTSEDHFSPVAHSMFENYVQLFIDWAACLAKSSRS